MAALLGLPVTAHPRLSARQLDVLRARCDAGSRKEAARQLGMTVDGVRWWLKQAFDACGCRDEAEACFRHHEELARELRIW